MRYPNLKSCRKLTVRASEIEKAIQRAEHRAPNDWQAELLEILRIPKVMRRWQKVNLDIHPEPTITFHPGKPWQRGKRPEDWTTIAGYTFNYGRVGITWNSVRDDYYGHSPSSAWDGVRRESFCSFAENLRNAYYWRGNGYNHRVESGLLDYRIEFVNDLEES